MREPEVTNAASSLTHLSSLVQSTKQTKEKPTKYYYTLWSQKLSIFTFSRANAIDPFRNSAWQL